MKSFFLSLKTERTAAKHTRPVKADMPIARPGAQGRRAGGRNRIAVTTLRIRCRLGVPQAPPIPLTPSGDEPRPPRVGVSFFPKEREPRALERYGSARFWGLGATMIIIRAVFTVAVLALAGVLVVALSGHLWGRYQHQTAALGFSGIYEKLVSRVDLAGGANAKPGPALPDVRQVKAKQMRQPLLAPPAAVEE